jgi:leucyl-tRNA synthetase
VNDLTADETAIAKGNVRGPVLYSITRNLVLMLQAFAPYLAAELWAQMEEDAPLLRVPWPAYEEKLAAEDTIEIPVQINGKLRALISVPAGSEEEHLRATALADAKIKAALAGREVVKAVVVPGKLVNFVVR